ncbi:hypothetical protein CKM354_000224000 [Cercospora kikuchii]|uniref:Major facilitator superfamily (MFS) profile domain-containing protein n=2 Tax=Cercospora kikuchii TaxID=84275 RepID=A0A9P3C9G9_9PEZI|nr:uncharacterized protein CKM354_000224000 [Cercospora kikuchii]GIZ38839.1 hypothetical protein CKM354_000224000 [Cercospora kikuchii]
MLGTTAMKQDPVAAAKEQEEEVRSEAVRDVDSEGSVSGRSRDEQELELARTATGPPYSIFTPRAKIFIVVAVSISSLISPFGGTTFLPALEPLARDLHVTPTLINLSLTTYMIAQGIAPALIAGMSDSNGRRLSYIICFIIFMIANIGLALQTSYAALLCLRMVQAFGCSAAIALSTAVVADISTSAERGRYMAYATAGLLLGPAFGPTIGGVFAEYLGWRWTFWFLVIFTGALLVVFIPFFPETCHNVVGNGSVPAQGINKSLVGTWQRKKYSQNLPVRDDQSTSSSPGLKPKLSFPNPLLMLKVLFDKESSIILLYNGFFFTGMMMVVGSVPTLFTEVYGLSTLHVGLCYIAQGAGSMASTLTMGQVVDWNFRRHARRLNMTISKGKQQDLADFPIERVRLQIVVPTHIVGTLGIILFGWTLHFETHLAGPEVALFLIGFGVSTAFSITNTLLIDLHRDKPATATAAVNFVRCLMSAAGAAAIIPMCNAMGRGWAFTFLALIYVVLLGAVFWIMAKGLSWRKQAAEQVRRANERVHNTEDADEKSVDESKHPIEQQAAQVKSS